MPELKATLLDVDPGRFRYSLWRNVSICVWADQATFETAQRVRALSARIVKQCPGHHSNVVFVLSGTPAPTPEASEIFAKLYDPQTSHLACMAMVLEGTGFWASGIRSTVTGMRLAARRLLTIGVHDTVEQAATWLIPLHLERTGVELDSHELLTVLKAVRARAADAAPA